eukprot:2650282-Lingulodinium_polyedra.AAC.1
MAENFLPIEGGAGDPFAGRLRSLKLDCKLSGHLGGAAVGRPAPCSDPRGHVGNAPGCPRSV